MPATPTHYAALAQRALQHLQRIHPWGAELQRIQAELCAALRHDGYIYSDENWWIGDECAEHGVLHLYTFREDKELWIQISPVTGEVCYV